MSDFLRELVGRRILLGQIDGPVTVETAVDVAGLIRLVVKTERSGPLGVSVTRSELEAALAREAAREPPAAGAAIGPADVSRDEPKSLLWPFMENYPSLALIKDQDLRTVYFNKAFLEAFDADGWLGKTPHELFPPEVAEPMIAKDRLAFERGAVHYEETWRDRFGAERVFETYKFRIDRGADPPLLGAIIHDITERKRSDDKLRTSEARYRSIFENTGTAMIIFDDEGIITLVNSNFERLSGYTAEEIEGKINWTHFVDANDLVLMKSYHRQRSVDPSSVPAAYEFGFVGRSGVRREIFLNISVVPGSKDRVASLMDVTDRKHAERALEVSRAQLQAVLDASLDAIAVTDERGTFLAGNRTLEEWSGKGRDEIIGHGVAEALPAEVVESRLAEISRCIATGQGDHFYDAAGGRQYENTIAPIVEADGGIRTVAMFSRDVTEQQRVEGELISLNQRLLDIIEFYPDATFVIDQNKRIVAWNKALEELTGVDKWTLLGKGDQEYAVPFYGIRRPILVDLLDTPDEQLESTYKSVRREGSKIFAESYVPTLNGGRGVHVWSVVAPLLDKDGNRFGAIEVIKDVSGIVHNEAARLKSEQRYSEILEDIDDGYYEMDLAGNVTFVNDAMGNIMGYAPGELIGVNARKECVDPGNAKEAFKTFNAVYATGKPNRAFDWAFVRKDGTPCRADVSISLRRDDDGNAIGFRGIARDVTGHRKLQEQLLQAQKMESIGQLAGGVAHDFNNMLTPILGYGEMLMVQLPTDDPRRVEVESIIKSAERSRDLVRQLLAFARKQALEMKPLDLNSVITNFEKILKRTLHENVAIDLRCDPSIGSILADVGQLEQIIVNLTVNAQDAMPGGGTLVIETGETVLDEVFLSTHKGCAPGRYVMMAVSDTGVGMDPAVLSMIFEPFYTTKAQGKGTGLGLSTVYGIVTQHNGVIEADSEPGRGTTFRLYFPKYGEAEVAAGDAERRVYTKSLPGMETVMVVEDEPLVRKMIVGILNTAGYTVLEAESGKSALEIVTSVPVYIHLLVSDMILPDTTGIALFETMRTDRPTLKVLYMSGYTADVIRHNNQLESDIRYLQKPFSLNEFTRRVREMLDR